MTNPPKFFPGDMVLIDLYGAEVITTIIACFRATEIDPWTYETHATTTALPADRITLLSSKYKPIT
jgi:hypothetical protein